MTKVYMLSIDIYKIFDFFQEDMGSPLIYLLRELVGLQSYSLNMPNQPVVYTRIFDYLQYIESTQQWLTERNEHIDLQQVHPI